VQEGAVFFDAMLIFDLGDLIFIEDLVFFDETTTTGTAVVDTAADIVGIS